MLVTAGIGTALAIGLGIIALAVLAAIVVLGYIINGLMNWF